MVKKYLNDARLKYSPIKMFFGVVFAAAGPAISSFHNLIGAEYSILLTSVCIIVSAYLLTTCFSLAKDITLELEDTLKVDGRYPVN